MREVLATLSFLIVVVCTGYYTVDIMKGRSRPARSTRVMLLLLIVVTLFQQHGLGSGWSLSLTLAEIVAAITVFSLSIKRGVGGLSRLDKICYGLLVLDCFIWFTTKNTLLALHLSILADTVALYPTLYKTWHDPQSESAVFFWAGVISPLFAIAAETHKSYQTLLFPVYISLINFIVVLLIYGLIQRKSRLYAHSE